MKNVFTVELQTCTRNKCVRELVKDGSSHLQNVSTKFKLCMKKLRDIQKDESQ